MKKIKKANLLLFTLILMFGFSFSVKAETKKGEYGDITLKETTMSLSQYQHKGSDSLTNLVIKNRLNGSITSGGDKLYYSQYYDATRAPKYGQNWAAIYCLDPATYSSNHNLIADRFLLADGTSKWLGTYDTALMYALTYNTDQYVAKSIAIRTITTLFKSNRNSTSAITNNFASASYELFASFYGLGIEWVKTDNDIMLAYNRIHDLLPDSTYTVAEMEKGSLTINNGKYVGTKTYNYNDYILASYSDSYTNNVSLAKEIVKGALNLAADYAENYNKGAKVTSTISNGKRTPELINNDTKLITYQETHNFTLSNFNVDDKANFTIKDLKFDKGFRAAGALAEPYIIKISVNNTVIYDRANHIGTFNYNDNILAYSSVKPLIKTGSDIKISVTIEGQTDYATVSKFSCDNINAAYTLYYHYDDSSLNINNFNGFIGIVWYPANNMGQRFLSYEKVKDYDGSTNTNGLDGTVTGRMKFLNCGCDELELACQESIKNYGTENTEACRTYHEKCDTCETTVSNDFQCCDEENKVILLEGEKHLSIDGPKNPVACFTKTDIETTDEAGNSYVQASNKYCRISCKEDYDFYMPSSRKTNSGYYFDFKMNINGTKTCYTNEIDTEQYHTDITKVQHDLVDYFNEYEYYKKAAAAASAATTTSTTCGSGEDTYTGTAISFSWSYTKYDYNGKGTTMTDGFYSSSCPATNPYSDFVTKRDAALKNLNDKKIEYQNTINDYNDCTEWNNIYTFDPEINYEYEENYDYNYEKPNMEDYNFSKFDNDNAELWYCNGSLKGNNYTDCNEVSDKFADRNVETIKNKKETYTYCDANGCQRKDEYIYNTKYVKKTATVEASYRPKTLFYYIKNGSGAVTTNSNRNNIEPIENGLPVSQSTRRGFYYYGIKITNLGEFYSGSKKGELGRLVGSTKSVAATENFKDKTNFANGNLEYDCTYLVNMGKFENSSLVCDFNKCEGPGCDFTCTGPGCNDTCEDGHCGFSCVGTGCIYSEGEGPSVFERQVKLDNLFPDGTVSRNWNVNGVDGLKDKAKATLNEIENLGEEVYNSEPILSVTITPNASSNLSAYNKSQEKNGGYSNETLECYDLNNNPNGACYSTVISEILNGKYGVEVNANSKIQRDNGYRVVGDVSGIRTNSNEDLYFVAWTDLSANGNDPSEMVIGPSWR